ncbi:hypothetical protein GGC63_001860 [Paenibacillus sp. OAS669]|nr:hypothetical protein [Paenibacillus sp. OAS669]
MSKESNKVVVLLLTIVCLLPFLFLWWFISAMNSPMVDN